MSASPGDVVLGTALDRRVGAIATAITFVLALVAYASGVFAVRGGVVVLPTHATYLGMLGGVAVGYSRGGVVVAWALTFAAYLGFSAEWAFHGLSGHTLAGQLAFLFVPTRLAVLAVGAAVFGTVAFGVGYLLGWGAGRVSRAKPG